MNSANEQLIVPVSLGDRSYEIVITSNRLAQSAPQFRDWLTQRPAFTADRGRCLLVTDKHLEQLYASAVARSLQELGWDCETAVLEPGEKTKSLSVISGLYDKLVALGADRQTVVLAVGGGVIGDAAGFLASTYARGIPFIQVPTSLLAQVDSSVGGKVGVNHPQAKNLIGAFYQPYGVFIDTQTLDTLPERDYCSGLGEVIKYGVILDANFFAELERDQEGLRQRTPDVMRPVIAQCCRLKAQVVEEDEYERTGLRAILNYGHTFAHAFEALCGYGELMHGEAVAIGMAYAARLACNLGLVDEAFVSRQNELTAAVGLPIALPENSQLDPAEILQRMKLDKKTQAGRLRFVLPTCMGHVEVFKDVTEEQVRTVLEELQAV